MNTNEDNGVFLLNVYPFSINLCFFSFVLLLYISQLVGLQIFCRGTVRVAPKSASMRQLHNLLVRYHSHSRNTAISKFMTDCEYHFILGVEQL